MTTDLLEQCAETVPSATDADAPNCLFVSTSLTTWTTANPRQFARDFQINDTVYRRLDPEYYAWLRSRMVVAKKAATAGHLPPAAFEELRVRFNAVHEWAVERFGESCLLDAIRNLGARGYAPPVAEPDAPPRAPQCVESPLQEALALVDEIRDRALALGWTHESLYAHAGSHRTAIGTNRGLVCFLKAADKMGEVTAHSIEIILPNDIRQRFYNPNVDQPWIRRVR
jgi:hypothetical protein